MLVMQDEMNRHVDADWLARPRVVPAIWIECAELMDHYGGWKWWKHASPDLEQAMLGIVDIWHFGLSLRITPARDFDFIAATVSPNGSRRRRLDFLEEVERLALAALGERTFAIGSVANLVAACGQDFDALYRTYVAKNVLNVFRQDHGYRVGTYRKTWQGREDNVVLAELVAGLDSDHPAFREHVYAALAEAYAAR